MSLQPAHKKPSQLVVPDGVNLDEREAFAYRVWLGKNEAPISPSTQGQMFQLYLQGKNCEEIRRLNPGFQLGAIVAARVAGKWDVERTRYLETLFAGIRQRVQQSAMETTDAICDLLAAKNKFMRDRVLRFIQTGDESLVESLKLGDIKAYKELVEALMKITGQDQNKKVSGTLNVSVTPAPAPSAPTGNAVVLAALVQTKRDEEAKKKRGG
jgi:hypothetical protein